MEKKLKGMGTAEAAGYIKAIFGKNYLTQANAFIDVGADKLRDYSAQLREASGAAAQMAGVMRNSIANKIEVLKSALMELGFKFVEAFQEKGVGLIEKLTDAVANFDPQPIIDAVTTTANLITDVIKIVLEFRDAILGIAIAWITYKTLMLIGTAVAPILDLIKIVQTLMKAQEGLNVATAIYYALMQTHPVGLIITAIGILIGLIIACEGKMQRLAGVFQLIGMVLAAVFAPALAAISPLLAPIVFFIGFIYSMLHELISSWDMLVETFKTEGIIAGLKRLGEVLLSGLLMPIQGLLELLAKIPGIGKFLGPVVDQISALRNQLKGIGPEIEDASKDLAKSVTSNNPAASVVPPAITNLVPETRAAPGVSPIRQPALLNLREGRLFRAGPVHQSSAASAASLWNVPVEPDLAKVPAPITQAAPAPARIISPAAKAVSVPVKYDFPEMIVPLELIRPVSVPVSWVYPPPPEALSPTTAAPPSPVPAPITQAAPVPARIIPPAAKAVSVPVKYDFPKVIVPPKLIRPVSVPVSWVYPPPPKALSTTTAAPPSPVPAPITQAAPPAAAGRIVPPAIVNSDPARVDRIVPPVMESPIAPSVGAALVPPAPPMTRAEQMAAEQVLYSKTESHEKIDLTISLDKGLEARVVNPPKSPNVKLEVSGTV
jgi:hypothetical protein